MKTAPTATRKPAALDFRESLLACLATKIEANQLVRSSIAALAAPMDHVRLIHDGHITMLARQVADPIPPGIGFGLWERGMLRPESVTGK